MIKVYVVDESAVVRQALRRLPQGNVEFALLGGTQAF